VDAEEELLDAYRQMLRIRKFEEKLMELKNDGQVPGSLHLCNGQEAIPVATCRSLEERDAVTATYRGHGWALARGLDPVDIFAEIMGRDSALCGGRAGSPFFSDPRRGFIGENSIVGAGVPIALGAAIAARHSGDGSISVVSIGDGALSQGATHEALNWAAAFALPLIVVVENNTYSEMTPVSEMVNIETLATRAIGYGIPSETVDGNDISAVEKAIRPAVGRARDGEGPSLIEAMTERLVGHYSGDAQQYRPKGEIERAKQNEPLERLRSVIFDTVEGAQEWIGRTEQGVTDEIDKAASAATLTDWARAENVLEHLYA